MIKGILFDFDGTLSYRVESAYYMYRFVARHMYPDLDTNSIEFEARVQRMMLWDEFGTIAKEHPFTMAATKWGSAIPVSEAVRLWRTYFHEYAIDMPDMYRVLTKLKDKYKLGAVSNGKDKVQYPKIEMLDVKKYFDFVLVSEDAGVNKPDPKIYLQASEMLGLKPEEIAFVGDTFDTDILGAYNVGMMPVWLCYEHRCVSNFPGITMIHDFKEIENLFL